MAGAVRGKNKNSKPDWDPEKVKRSMKKLMTIAAAALCASVFADGITSANVVGYDQFGLRGNGAAIGAGASFVNVDGSDLTLGDITVTGYDTKDGYAEGQVQAKQLDGYGRGGTTYYWCDFVEEETAYKGWYDNDMNEYNDLKLAPGEGLWIYSPSTDFKIQSSGAVPASAISVTLRGNGAAKMVANPMPTTLTLAQVSVEGYDANDGYAEGQVQAKKLDGYGRGGTTYYFCDFEEEGITYFGWYDNDMNDYNDVEVTPGEGLWIYSPSTDFSVVFPSPLAE